MAGHAATDKREKNLGWRNVFAGMGINLALGILYTWSVISKSVPEKWGWNEDHKSLPYMVACLIFSLVMVPAGRLQDKYSPRLVASIGGILVGAGFIVAGMTSSLWVFVIGFGVLTGAGLGFGYASATPPAVKWFPPARTGMVAGIVVSGFGLASVYAAPVTTKLIGSFGFQTALVIWGVAFLGIVVGLAQLLKAPHKALQFSRGYGRLGALKEKAAAQKEVFVAERTEFEPREVLRTSQFYLLWFMYACGAGAGLMIIGKLAAIGNSLGISLGFVLVAVLAAGNGGGRIVAGIMSDRLGRKATLGGCFLLQAALILLLSRASEDNLLGTLPAMAVLSALIGANYGANLSLFPAITKDYYGLKHFGMNYGMVFSAWGVGGFMLAKLAGAMYVKYETFAIAYYGAACLLILAAVTVVFLKTPQHASDAAAERVRPPIVPLKESMAVEED